MSIGGARHLKVAGATASIVLFAASTTGAAASRALASSPTAAPCPVTVPDRAAIPDADFGPNSFNHGNRRLRVELWPRGILRAGILPDGDSYATINRDGSIRAKVGWWVRDPAKLVIVGKRLDRIAPPLRAHIPSGYGPQYDIGASLGFQPTGLTFPTVGCWRVVGTAGTARLSFVVRVTKLQ
jgi:hypothetical protein